jgi:hypothetical protein
MTGRRIVKLNLKYLVYDPDRHGSCLRCQSAPNFDPRLECTPVAGQVQAAVFTSGRACFSS